MNIPTCEENLQMQLDQTKIVLDDNLFWENSNVHPEMKIRILYLRNQFVIMDALLNILKK
jgi:hypothetical protein